MTATDHDDMELVRLEEEVSAMARDLVQRAGGYPPFGATIDTAGHVALLFDQAAVNGGATAETGASVVRIVRAAATAADIRAAAVANMAYRNDQDGGTDTVMVISLHHRAGRCIDFVIPFTQAASGEVHFGEQVVGLGKTQLF